MNAAYFHYIFQCQLFGLPSLITFLEESYQQIYQPALLAELLAKNQKLKDIEYRLFELSIISRCEFNKY